MLSEACLLVIYNISLIYPGMKFVKEETGIEFRRDIWQINGSIDWGKWKNTIFNKIHPRSKHMVIITMKSIRISHLDEP